jgi:membrane-associated phospholipid phosphatase
LDQTWINGVRVDRKSIASDPVDLILIARIAVRTLVPRTTSDFRRCVRARQFIAGALLILGASPVLAQEVRADTARADSALSGPLFTKSSAWIAGGALAGTAALMLADRGIPEDFRDPGPQGSRALRDAASGFNWLGDPGTVVLSVALYGSGRLFHQSSVAEIGLRSAEAIAISAAATYMLKGIAGRNRPYVNNLDSDHFGLGSGFGSGGHTSFPSGHSTAAFALASVVASESKIHWPHAARYVPFVAYGAATAVAVARVYSDKHWASDVFLGAGIGTLTGLGVVRYHRLHPDSRLDRWLLHTQIMLPGPGQVGVGWTMSAP